MEQENSFKWSLVPFQFFAGVVILVFNVPGFLRYAAHHWVSNGFIISTLELLADIPESIYSILSPSDGDLFTTLLRFSIYGVGLYLLGVGVLALRKQEARLIPGAIISLVTGILAVAIMLWAFAILLWLGQAIITLVIFLWPYIKILFYVIAGIAVLFLVGYIFVFLWQKFGIWGIIGLLALGAIIWFAWPYIWLSMVWLVKFIIKILPWVVGIGIAIIILLWVWNEFSFPGILTTLILAALAWFGRSIIYTVILWIYHEILLPILVVILKALLWLGEILGIIFAFLFRAFVFIVFVLMGIGIVAFLGNMLLDDLRAAWNGGSGMKGVILASFGIGLAIALILLASAGSVQSMTLVDEAWSTTIPITGNFSLMGAFLSIMPNNYQSPLQAIFSTVGIPVFDAVLLAAVLGFNYVGLIRGLGREREDKFHVSFIGKEATALAIGAPLVLLVAIFFAIAPSED